MCRQTCNTYKIKTNQSQKKKMETGKSNFWRWKEFNTQTKKGRLCHFAQISKRSQMQHKQRQKDLFCDALRVLSFNSKKHKYLNRWKENGCFYNPSYHTHTHTKKKYQNNCSKKKLISAKRLSKQKLLSQAREFPSVLTLFTFQNQATSLLQPKASSPFRPWQGKSPKQRLE